MNEYGQFNRKIIIESPTRVADAAGQKIETWATFLTVWAKKEFVRGFDGKEADRIEASTRFIYTIPEWKSTITESMRINDGTNYLYIFAIEPVGFDQGMALHVRIKDHNEE